MGNDRSPESQHNVGDTIIYDAQRQTVFNLGSFNWDNFHSISDENKTVQYFPIHIMVKMAQSSFNKGPFDLKGGQWPHGTLLIEHWQITLNLKQ